jgi:hypothetical protein
MTAFRIGLFFLGLLLFGCSSEPSRLGVTGTVKIDGAPAPLTVIRFFPVDAGTDPRHASTATSDDKGSWSLKQTGKNVGLPAGEYKVTFSQTLVNGKATLGGSGGKASERLYGEKEAIPEVYRNQNTTTIVARVGRDSTTFDFDIKKK